MNGIKEQLTVRGVVIGAIGCVIITLASAYTALKLGALPWPIVFAAIISLFFLKAISRGRATLNEANVTHTIMSAGAMVAGGLAFTIPGIWMLGAGDVDFLQMTAVAVAGVILGLICTGALRKHFIEDAKLEYPIGEAAAQTLRAGDTGGHVGLKLFGAMGAAAVYTALRDAFKLVPAMLAQTNAIPGVAFAIYNSPMMLSVGFLVSAGAILAWFAGALLGNLGIVSAASMLGFWDIDTGKSIASSLGIGIMMGCGVAVIIKDILPKAWTSLKAFQTKGSPSPLGLTAASTKDIPKAIDAKRFRLSAGLAALGVAVVALLLCIVLHLDPLAAIVVVILSWVTSAMAAQSVGQTGIDPMEIFGLLVLLAVAAFSSMPQVQLFFVAAVIAVSCGLAGDVMNDFHAGHVLGTNPQAQLIGQAIGGIIGAIVAAAVMFILGTAYGPDAFGPGAEFVAAQASVVASMISGVVMTAPFVIGLVIGFALYVFGLPSMMVGLGVYLPFYMSITASIGAAIKLVIDAICKRREASLPDDERVKAQASRNDTGVIIASGILGGESIVGVVLALIAVASGFLA